LIFTGRRLTAAMEKSNRGFPGFTGVLALLALLAHASDRVSAALIYDRTQILDGQLWRLWSGHAVHFGSSHLWWNLAVFLPTGIWLERGWPALTRGFYGLCPLVISAAMLLLQPSLARYAGLSGVATGMLVLLAALQLRRKKEEPAWFWWSVLVLVAIKIGVELFTGSPLLVSGFGDVKTVPLAHIAGVATGLAFWAATNRRGPGS